MPKKKQTKNISVYEEMNTPQREVEETLPYSYIKEEGKEETPQRPIQKEETDYLDEIPQMQRVDRPQSQPLMFSGEAKENLIADLLKVDWERIEHIIRGHKPKVDDEGNEYFVKIEGHYLNDNGVNQVLHFLTFYLGKEIQLSRYDSEDVEIRMKQFSQQFTDWFYDNVEEFGLDTPAKKKMSKMFVHAVIDLVDASYRHAIEGRTIELMLKQFQVLQQQAITETGMMPMQNNQPKQRTSFFGRIFG